MAIRASDVQAVEQMLDHLQPPCEIVAVMMCPVHGVETTRCDQPAEWILRARCACGNTDTALICDDHAHDVKSPDTCAVPCTRCRAHTPPDRLHLERI